MIYAQNKGLGILLGNRFVTCMVLAGALLVADFNQAYSQKVRELSIDYVIHPLAAALDLPSRLYFDAVNLLTTNRQLKEENNEYRAENQELAQLKRSYEQLAHRNAQLEQLTHYLRRQQQVGPYLTVSFTTLAFSEYREQVLINAGSNDGARAGQVLLNQGGLIGVIFETTAKNSVALIITDTLSAVPARIARNGLITSVRGQGLNNPLALDYIRADADIRVGDLIETSGLGGTFPERLPIGRVVSAKNDLERKSVIATAQPFAKLEYHLPMILLVK